MLKKYHINEDFKRYWQNFFLNWYSINKRDLPWRKPKHQNFYNIWISEVMLQQTIVKTVIPYYEKFLRKWPNLNSFKDASLEEILFIWQGLGYYQRAKNLFKAKEFLKKNKLVVESQNLKKIPGIGDYISCSISAILKDEPCAVIDGNIKRIITRVFDLDENDKFLRKKINEISQGLTPKNHNGVYCQSLMDFANLVCKARRPICNNCDIQPICKYNDRKSINIKSKREIIRKIGIGFFVRKDKRFLIEISKKSLLEGLYSIPFSDFLIAENINEKKFIENSVSHWISSNKLKTKYKIIGKVIHTFSHFHLKLFLVDIKLDININFKKYKWTTLKEFNERPQSTLTRKILKTVI